MDFLSHLQWQEPAWLLLIPTMFFIYFFYIKHEKKSRITALIPEKLLHYVLTIKREKKTKQPWLFFTASLLICIAVAGPFLNQPTSQQQYPGANVVIILDISPSMAVKDINPNRLQQSKIQLKKFIRSLKQTRLALVIFSANAYTVLPLTQDKQSVIHFVDAMRPDLVSIPGSNLSLAITLAENALNIPTNKEQPSAKGLVILISDGEIHDSGAWQATQKLAEQGHKLFTIGVGTKAGGPVPLPNGQLVRENGKLITSQLHRQTLVELANKGRGNYFYLSPDAWKILEQEINQLERTNFENNTTQQTQMQLFPWFLAIAFSIILTQTIRRPEAIIIIAIAATSLCFSPRIEASPWQEKSALIALKQGNNSLALTQYKTINNFNGFIGQGVSFYRIKRWTEALSKFQSALKLAKTERHIAQANYNIGNTLIQKKEFSRAKKAFQRTLIAISSHQKAAFNLTLLKKHTKQSKNKTNEKSKHPLNDTTKKTTTLNQNKIGIDKQRNLKRNLKQWGELIEYKKKKETSPLKQLQMLKEDSETMLRKRFAIIDKNTPGLAEEKSW